MSDNKIKTAPEVAYWSKRLTTTPEKLRAAVKKVGVMVDDVEKELKGK